jgi:hypothetical protein
MKRLFFLCIGLAALAACKNVTDALTPEPVKHANVIMLEGPIFEDGYIIFEYKGRLQNVGEVTAKFTKVYVYVRKSDNSLIAQEDTYADDTELVPQETTAWNVIFMDENHSIRDQMDKSKLTYEIKWDED